MSKKLLIICGISPGASGVGQLIQHLIDQSRKHHVDVDVIYGVHGSESIKPLLRRRRYLKAIYTVIKRKILAFRFNVFFMRAAYLEYEKVVLIHPQSIGTVNCSDVISRRKGNTWLYLMDSSFFCLRSYNYIPHENTPCFRCLGGNEVQAAANQCQPFPVRNEDALHFVKRLLEYGRQGIVSFYTQTAEQNILLSAHFGSSVKFKTVGLWTSDIEAAHIAGNKSDKVPPAEVFDVVFHGAGHPAKGMDWAMNLAATCPDLTFFFPFARPSGFASNNCTFMDTSWDSTLEQYVRLARVVLVPSLWSAPIEGALIKSIMLAKCVAVVDLPSQFSSEIPEDIVLKLPVDIEAAGSVLREYISSGSLINIAKRNDWIHKFVEFNSKVLQSISEE